MKGFAQEKYLKENENLILKIIGSATIINYSDAAFVVIGSSKNEKMNEKFKKLKGVYNFKLKCGHGWVFKKIKFDDVVLILEEFV